MISDCPVPLFDGIDAVNTTANFRQAVPILVRHCILDIAICHGDASGICEHGVLFLER